MPNLILATNNKNKIIEIKTILSSLDVEIMTLSDLRNPPKLVEDGATCRDNALRKARTVFEIAKTPALADDSALEVFYLNGRPGVISARYAGENATYKQNNDKLLGEMRGVPSRRRRAQFRAVIAFVGHHTEEITEGICVGNLAEEPRGTCGFGYDPIFIPDGFDRTYAELTAEQKNKISHRAIALERMKEVLRRRL